MEIGDYYKTKEDETIRKICGFFPKGHRLEGWLLIEARSGKYSGFQLFGNGFDFFAQYRNLIFDKSLLTSKNHYQWENVPSYNLIIVRSDSPLEKEIKIIEDEIYNLVTTTK